MHACPHLLSLSPETIDIIQHRLSASCIPREDELLSGMMYSVDSLSLSIAKKQDCLTYRALKADLKIKC